MPLFNRSTSGSAVVGRLSPSPTGRMHIGNVYASLAAWAHARAANGRVILRIEDIDTPRTVSGAAEQIMRDFEWLGIDWDGTTIYQSHRLNIYQNILNQLIDAELAYPCFCSRADIRAASAPHESDGFIIYPGTCKNLSKAERTERIARGERHSWRLTMPAPEPNNANPNDDGIVRFEDEIFGPQSFELSTEIGDIVIQRSDGLFAYQFATSIDDYLMGVNDIVRGRDLLRSTAVQLYIRTLVSALPDYKIHKIYKEPICVHYAHLPLIDNTHGKRLAKRDKAAGLGELIEQGMDAESIIGVCARMMGIQESNAPLSASDFLEQFATVGLANLRADSADRVLATDLTVN